MIDYRKAIIAVIIGILFTIFVQTSIEAVYERPLYDDFCENRLLTPYDKGNATDQEIEEWNQQQRDCSDAYQNARDQHSTVVFYVSALLGLVSIVIALFWSSASPVGMAVSSGLLLGGLFTLFFGTLQGWGGIGVKIRPFVILIELIVVIVVSYMKLNDKMKKKK